VSARAGLLVPLAAVLWFVGLLVVAGVVAALQQDTAALVVLTIVWSAVFLNWTAGWAKRLGFRRLSGDAAARQLEHIVRTNSMGRRRPGVGVEVVKVEDKARSAAVAGLGAPHLPGGPAEPGLSPLPRPPAAAGHDDRQGCLDELQPRLTPESCQLRQVRGRRRRVGVDAAAELPQAHCGSGQRRIDPSSAPETSSGRLVCGFTAKMSAVTKPVCP
jgi:hypothetical protein